MRTFLLSLMLVSGLFASELTITSDDKFVLYGCLSKLTLIISGDGHGAVILPKVEQYIFAFIDNTN